MTTQVDIPTTATQQPTQAEHIEALSQYRYGWHDSDIAGATARRGLSEAVVREISAIKDEPEWMLERRLRALKLFNRKPLPNWGADLSSIDFDSIKYYVRSTERQATSWEELPEDIKNTYDRLGIPEAEKARLVAGVAAQYESEVVYHKINEELERQGVIFLDTDTGLKEHPELFQEYFGTVIPAGDNKFSALNTAVWSGGSFIYVPKGVHVTIPLQAYFRINTENMGQFERTLIIADEGSHVHYVEGCTRRSTRPTRCTPPWWRSSSRRTRGSGTPPSRTGPTTSTTWSPSARPAPRARPWSGSTATSAPRSP